MHLSLEESLDGLSDQAMVRLHRRQGLGRDGEGHRVDDGLDLRDAIGGECQEHNEDDRKDTHGELRSMED
jgi:hypothetical protein